MKKIFFFIVVFLFNSSILFSQVGVNTDSSLPDSSAMLDVKSTTRGFLPPRMTKMELSAIINPADGLIVYCTNCSEDGQGMLAIFMNGAWQMVGTNCKIEKPTEGTHVPGQHQIEWKWHPVAYATSYKWNTTSDFGTAVDLNYDTSRTETGLICNTIYTRYVWAFNDCISSTPLTMTGTTGNCFNLPCGQPMTVNHIAGDVAPVSKTVLYNTIGEIPGEPGKCWITQNLGADHEADTVIDDTEVSAGWYWQFNRKQGYKHDGTTRTPNTTWITANDENSEWQISQDPCNKELGGEWRIPSYSEWYNINSAGGWTNWYGPWNAGLKLHAAGDLYSNNGSLGWRGVYGNYWSSTQSGTTNGWLFSIYIGLNQFLSGNKAFGFPLRCLKDTCGIATPAPDVHTFTETAITWTWKHVTGAAGYKWSTIEDTASAIDVGTDTTKTETGLICNTGYNRYVWAYNDCGTSIPADLSQTTSACSFVCGTSTITVNHVAGDVAPVTKTVTYGTVTNIPGEETKCWITQNLGADRQALSVDDYTEESAGWYWQFNLKQGYKLDSLNIRTPNTTWITQVSGYIDWQSANDPCGLELGAGWRIPTLTEWINVVNYGNGPWNSGLKLHAAGYLEGGWGEGMDRGFTGNYWSSTNYNVVWGWYLFFYYDGPLLITGENKALGYSLRCIKSCIPPASPGLGNHVPSPSQIIWKWNPVPGVYGYKWNDTCDFTTAIDMGNATSYTETGLTCITDYHRYVWAYIPCGCSQVLALNSATTLDPPPAPPEGDHVIGPTEIVWKWDTVPGATGYKWNSIYNYDAAIDMGTLTSKAQTDLTCLTNYYSYVWAYSGVCGKSCQTNLEATTAIDPPQVPKEGNHIPTTKKIEWKWDASPGATYYVWNKVNDFYNYDYMVMSYGGSIIETGLIPNYTYTRYVWAINDCGHSDPVTLTQATNLNPGPPTEGDHTEGSTLIVWRWNLGFEADFSRWNTTADYSTSVVIGSEITQTGLTPSTTYTCFVWDCNMVGGYSEAVQFSATTFPSFNCDVDTLVINHNTSGGVAPVNRTVVYGTADSLTGMPLEPDLCWITRNLGALQQADSINDTTEASRGWFWQFNRKQGYPQTTIPFPSWVISNSEPNWQAENDPCRLELGSPWRIPTNSEWSEVRAWGGWIDCYGPWNSELKLHMAGDIIEPNNQRGPDGWYWSSFSEVMGWALWIRISSCVMNPQLNNYACPLRCVREL